MIQQRPILKPIPYTEKKKSYTIKILYGKGERVLRFGREAIGDLTKNLLVSQKAKMFL